MKVRCHKKKMPGNRKAVSGANIPISPNKSYNQTRREKVRFVLDGFTSLVALISCSLAFLTLFFTLYPQHKPSNTDYLEMANAGDIESQVKLADLNYKIGHLDNALYWYEIAALEESEYQGIALNNLSSIYLNHTECSAWKTNVYRDCMNMFQNATEAGLDLAAQNLYLLLISNPPDYFGKQYSTMLDYVEEQLADNEDVLRNLSQSEVQWTYIETIDLEQALSKYGNDPEYDFVTHAPVVYNEDYVSKLISYTDVYKRSTDVASPTYIYIELDIT